jgi:hypothetical protein
MYKGFQKPKRLVANTETLTDRYGMFTAQPFQRGFGTTIGNSLRRVLLSSIEGAAITAVRIEGVEHEFSPIPGVVEDATDIILNLKQIPFKIMGDGVKTVRLSVDQHGDVRSGQIETDQDIEVLDRNMHIATIGEGGMQTGATHEGMNIAAVEQVPLVLVATNNHYAYSTPNEREFACHDLKDRAKAYGFEGDSVDGTDLAACLDVIGGAVKRARAGRPPQFVVAECLRLAGHGEHDDASYVTEDIKREPFARDCLKVAEQTIADLKLADTETMAEWRKEAAAKVDEAIATAQKEAPPEGDKEDWCALSTRDLVDQLEKD